jgi:hypothetical protein
MLAAFGQKEIAGPQRVPDREGEGDLPDLPVNVAVFDEKGAPGRGHEAIRIVGRGRLARTGVKFPQDRDRRDQLFTAGRRLERQHHECRQVLAECAVACQHCVEMTALLQPIEGPACRSRLDKSWRIDLLPEGPDSSIAGGRGERIYGCEHAVHAGPGTPAQDALLGLDRVLSAPVHAGQELVIHLDQLVEQGLASLDEVTGDQRVAFRLGKTAEISGIIAAPELAELTDDLGIDLAKIGSAGKQLLDKMKARDIALDCAGRRALGIILEAEQAGARIALRYLDQKIDRCTQAAGQPGGDHLEEPSGGVGDLGTNDPRERARRWKDDPPAPQPVVDKGQQFGRAASFEDPPCVTNP